MLSNDLAVTIILSTLMFLLLIAGVIITVFIANRRNTHQEMTIAQMQIDYEQELRKVQHEVQEQVLVNTGRELHDNIGQLLTVIHLQVEQHKYLNPGGGRQMETISSTLSETISEVRRLGKSLNSELFEQEGLINAIHAEVARIRQLNKYTVKWEYDTEPQLTKDQKVITFRILQEILNNILKHAGGSHIAISLTGGDNRFKMMVQDNGKGFDVAAMTASGSGSGLKNMLKRAELAKMTCAINSVTGKGTTFILESNS